MSTPSLNAEKWLLPTVLLYCRRTLQHLNPRRGNLILSPRMSHSTFIGLCLVLFLALLFFRTSDWATTDVSPVLLFHQLSCHAPTGVYIYFRCSHLMACLVRVPRTKNLYLRPSWSVYVAPCVFFSWLPCILAFSSAECHSTAIEFVYCTSLTSTIGLQW